MFFTWLPHEWPKVRHTNLPFVGQSSAIIILIDSSIGFDSPSSWGFSHHQSSRIPDLFDPHIPMVMAGSWIFWQIAFCNSSSLWASGNSTERWNSPGIPKRAGVSNVELWTHLYVSHTYMCTYMLYIYICIRHTIYVSACMCVYLYDTHEKDIYLYIYIYNYVCVRARIYTHGPSFDNDAYKFWKCSLQHSSRKRSNTNKRSNYIRTEAMQCVAIFAPVCGVCTSLFAEFCAWDCTQKTSKICMNLNCPIAICSNKIEFQTYTRLLESFRRLFDKTRSHVSGFFEIPYSIYSRMTTSICKHSYVYSISVSMSISIHTSP